MNLATCGFDTPLVPFDTPPRSSAALRTSPRGYSTTEWFRGYSTTELSRGYSTTEGRDS